MKTNLFSSIFLCLLSLTTFAQEHKDWFRTIYPLGTEFTNRKGILNDLDLGSPLKKSKVKIKDFKESNDYFIDRFLNSGKVIAYSKSNRYLDLVADKLLAKDPELRKKVKFYLVNSSEVNAFTFTNGMIFFNMGLFSRLENEAQLAFVMAHEIAHFKQKHAFERYKFGVDSEVEDMSEEEFYEVVLSKFSRNQEFEADDIGFEIYRNSNYPLSAATQVFELLKLSDYPLTNKTFEKSVFESAYLKIPRVYYSDSIIPTIPFDDENDSLHSHPSCSKRQAALIKKFESSSNKSASVFQVNEADFLNIKKACQFALCETYLHEKEYVNALYHIELLLQEYPKHPFLLNQKVKSYYYLLANINSGNTASVIKKPKNIKGEISKFHQLFKSLSADEINMLALRSAWDIHLAEPKLDEVKLFTHGITKYFISKVTTDINYFAKLPDYNEDSIASFYNIEVVQTQAKRKKYNSSSGGMIRKTKKNKNQTFVRYAIPDLIENDQFKRVFNSISRDVIAYQKDNPTEIEQYDAEEDEPSKERSSSSARSASTDKKAKNVSAQKRLKKEEPFKTDKILIIDVSNVNLDLTSGKPVKYFAIQNKQRELVSSLQECANLAGIELQIFNPVDFKVNDSIYYNDRNVLESWKMERITNRHLTEILPSEYNQIAQICERYGTQYVSFVNTRSIILPYNQSFLLLNMLYTAYNPPLFVAVMVSLFKYQRYSAISIPIVDIKTGKVVADYSAEYDSPDHKDLMKAEFYNFFNSIKK
ncbi:MAG: M48 family metalloprotease [Bacteroidia bacterium]|nr:M48 family metalloprotease [Bacteroidia bacterium]